MNIGVNQARAPLYAVSVFYADTRFFSRNDRLHVTARNNDDDDNTRGPANLAEDDEHVVVGLDLEEREKVFRGALLFGGSLGRRVRRCPAGREQHRGVGVKPIGNDVGCEQRRGGERWGGRGVCDWSGCSCPPRERLGNGGNFENSSQPLHAHARAHTHTRTRTHTHTTPRADRHRRWRRGDRQS